MFLDAGGDRKNIRVENDVGRIEADFLGKDFVGALADLDLALDRVGLALFVERHDDDGGAVVAAQLACSMNDSSPSFRLIELTTALPCTHLRPASMTVHLDESIMIGRRATSGSDAIRFRNVTIACSESSMPSSILTSMICAPLSTCWRATATAAA